MSGREGSVRKNGVMKCLSWRKQNKGNYLKASGVVNKWARRKPVLDQLSKEEGKDHAG